MPPEVPRHLTRALFSSDENAFDVPLCPPLHRARSPGDREMTSFSRYGGSNPGVTWYFVEAGVLEVYSA